MILTVKQFYNNLYALVGQIKDLIVLMEFVIVEFDETLSSYSNFC